MTNTEARNTENSAAVAKQRAQGAPEKATSKKGATPKKGAPKGQETAKGKAKAAAQKKVAKTGKNAAKPVRAKDASTQRAESKGAKILELIGRAKGATLAELMSATNWQRHSIRGFLSTAAKKRGIKIDSTKNEAGERVYRTKN